MIKTDIIIPTYENEEYTVACLDSIKKCTQSGAYRVIWVDNGSKNTALVAREIMAMEHITILSPTNEGFVGAINSGLEVSDAPAVCLLNNDTQVSLGWLEKLIAVLYSDPTIGIVGPLTGPPAEMQQFDSHHNIAYQQRFRKVPVFPDWVDLEDFNRHIEKQLPRVTGAVDFVAFLCALIKRDVIDKIGFLDSKYVMGMWDDADYNFAAQKAGYKTLLVLDTCIYHHGRATFKMIQEKENFNVDALLAKNRAYLEQKWGTICAQK